MSVSAPVISVLIPAFNAERTIAVALESLRRQTYTNWQCIVCDDGSTDATRAIVERFARRDRRYMLERLAHGGIVSALNHGLSVCRGRYVARFDADDLMQRERLELQLAVLERDSATMGVGCAVRIFPRRHMTQGLRAYECWVNSLANDQLIMRDRYVECPLVHPTLLVRSAVLRQFGYRDMHWPEDYDLVLRLLGAGHRLSTVPRRLLHWRDDESRLSRTSRAYGNASFTKCKAHFLAQDWLANADHYVLWGYGDTGRQLAKALAAFGKHPQFIVEVHPGRIGQRILSVPVLSIDQLANQDLAQLRIIVSVAGLRPRTDARRFAASLGLVEGTHYVCAA